jgi:adenylate cyclase
VTVPEPSPLPTSEDFEELLLGSARALTAAQVAELADTDLDTARRYWRALGFPDVGDDVAFTALDADALRAVSDLVQSGAVDEETALRLVRALGRTTARLAEWQVQTLTDVVERRERAGAGSGSRLLTAYGIAARVLPAYERALLQAWRRHLGAAAARYVAAGAETQDGLLTRTVTVGSADIVSFTRLSRGLDDDGLAAVVEGFESVAADAVTACGARLVKTLGDEVLFVSVSAVRAARAGLAIVDRLRQQPGVPPVRVGLASGPVVRRLGDVFGTPVNLAARLRSLAEPDTVLADLATAEALRADGVAHALDEPVPRDVPGFGLVPVVRVLSVD